MNFQNWLHMATDELAQSESPRRSAEILLGYVTGKARTWILAFGETSLTDAQSQQLGILLTRRKNGEPIPYLTGKREFWSLPLCVSSATLIPRPDTECLVEQTLARLPSSTCRILDLGTGTGAIALALGSECQDCQIIAVDVIPNAVQLARYNVECLGVQNVQVMQSNWFSALTGEAFDVIVSNPPYIDEKEPYLSQGDVRFEPRSALVAAEKGLADIRHIVETSRQYFRSVGWLFIEHGWTQGEATRTLFTKAGFCDVETCRDYAGNDRLTLGRWCGVFSNLHYNEDFLTGSN